MYQAHKYPPQSQSHRLSADWLTVSQSLRPSQIVRRLFIPCRNVTAWVTSKESETIWRTSPRAPPEQAPLPWRSSAASRSWPESTRGMFSQAQYDGACPSAMALLLLVPSLA